MTLRRSAVARYGPGSVEAVIPPPCPPCSVLRGRPLPRPTATMTSA